MQRIYSEHAVANEAPFDFDHHKYMNMFNQACVKAGNVNAEFLTTLGHGHVDQADLGVQMPVDLKMEGMVGDIGWSVHH